MSHYSPIYGLARIPPYVVQSQLSIQKVSGANKIKNKFKIRILFSSIYSFKVMHTNSTLESRITKQFFFVWF